MATDEISSAQDTDMSECDGEKVVTMMDVLQEQQDAEADANAVLGASDDKNCTYSEGYIKRQALYACMTCCEDARVDPTKRAAVCLACSLTCHENHELVELYTKRNFRCDCGNSKFPKKCQIFPNKTDINFENKYDQNFSGLYCICHRPYPDLEAPYEDEMIQCSICEDWLHSEHLEAIVPDNNQYTEMICKCCMNRNEFLFDYCSFAVNCVESDIDIMSVVETSGDKVNKDEETNSDVSKYIDENKEQEIHMCLEMNTTVQQDTIPKETANHENNMENADQQQTISSETNETKEPENAMSEPSDTKINEDNNAGEAVVSDLEEIDKSKIPEENIVDINDAKLKETSENTIDDPKEQPNDNLVKTDDTKMEETSENATNNPIECNIEEPIAEKTEANEFTAENSCDPENATMREPTETNKINNAIAEEPDVFKIEELDDSKIQTSTNILKANDTTIEEVTEKVTEDLKENNTEQSSVNISEENNTELLLETQINNQNEDEGIKMNGDLDSHKIDNAADTIINAKSSETINTNLVENTNMEIETTEKINNDSETNIHMEISKESINSITEATTLQNGQSVDESLKETATSQNNEQESHNKRKLEDNEDLNSKKPKLVCQRPKGSKKTFKGATFWPSNFRQKLCTCNQCVIMYEDLSVLFLLDPEDTVSAYEMLGKAKESGESGSQYEKGLEALSSLDRTQQINALTEYNRMRDKLLDFLKSFKERKEVVKEEDIKAFFAGMKPKREPDGVYFCR